MKKFARFRFFEEDHPLLADHQPPPADSRCLAAAIVPWGCGARITLAVIQENHHHGETSSDQTVLDDDVEPGMMMMMTPPVSRNSADSSLHQNPTSDIDRVFEISSNNPTAALDDEVGTTLRLSSRPPLVYNPTPLRWFRPESNGVDDHTRLSLSPPYSSNKKSRKSGKKRRVGGAVEEGNKRRRRNNGNDEDQRPLVPIEEIEGLAQAVELRGGVLVPEEAAGVGTGCRGERVMEFLREEEAAAVCKGVTMVGVDGGGNVYEKVMVKWWGSMKVTVINSDWYKIAAANNGEKGDVVQREWQ